MPEQPCTNELQRVTRFVEKYAGQFLLSQDSPPCSCIVHWIGASRTRRWGWGKVVGLLCKTRVITVEVMVLLHFPARTVDPNCNHGWSLDGTCFPAWEHCLYDYSREDGLWAMPIAALGCPQCADHYPDMAFITSCEHRPLLYLPSE